MNITFFSTRYYNGQIKIINKKQNFCTYINRCNQYCNSINPIYCCNCLYLIESDPNLNFHFSDYILVNNHNNDYYHVLRNSINNSFNNYNNNFNEEYYYNEDYYSQNYEENEFTNNNYLNQENSNYNFDNETIMSNISELTNNELEIKNDTTNVNNCEITQDSNELEIKNDITNVNNCEITQDSNELEIKNDITNVNNCEITQQDSNELEIKNVNNCEITQQNSNEFNLIDQDFNKSITIESNLINESEISNDINESIAKDSDLINKDLNESEISDHDLNNNELLEDNIEKKVYKLSKQEKNKLKKKRKNERKKLEKIKIDEEKKLLDEMQNLNRINLLEKFSKIGLDEKELKIINSLSYKELSDKIEKPIIYDIKNKFLELYNLKNHDVILNMSIYDDFKDFELSDKESVDKIVSYLKKSKFNRFYFNSVYELIYFNKLIIYIKDKDDNVLDSELIKNNNEVIFYEQILEDEINEYFRDFMIKVIIIPFIKKKKEELKNKYEEYEDKLLKKKVLTFEENLLINYRGMNKIGGNMYFGRKGIFKFDKDNNVNKIYIN